MNVTNSSEQEATPQQQQQQQHQQLNSNNTTNNRAPESEEEPIVTSTSNDHNLSQTSPAYVQQQEQQVDTTITSPARITSSTGNDCSISPPLPQQQHQEQQVQSQLEQQQTIQRNNNNRQQHKIESTIDGSRKDDSSFKTRLIQQQKQEKNKHQQKEEYFNIGDGVMPTTSSAAIAAAVNNLRPNHLNNAKLKGAGESANTADSSEMVARNLLAPAIADSGGCGETVVQNAIPAVNENHKIILKLPRTAPASTAAILSTVSATTATAMSTTAATTESQMDVDPTMSNSSTNSSNNRSVSPEDTRKVEPLKINLHPSHSTVVQQHVVPKITIKPIIKTNAEETDASCSSSADDDPPIPKLTIKAANTAAQHSSSSSSATEPHVVPKLTIRSASGEEGSGAAQIATIVPRLTIKISDSTQSGSTACSSSSLSPPAAQQAVLDQAPLPKLTIKTSLDGTSNSIISHISPASLSSSSPSSSTSSYSSTTATTATVPKLTIKNIPKPDDLVVPKLTIKTNAAGNSECATTTTPTSTATSSVSAVVDAADEGTASKIPKLTIKTGQETAVIITQHTDATHAQSIPKLTIKTKSLDCTDVTTSPLSSQEEQSAEPPPEKIPKLTIKTSDVQDAAADAPKFCIKTQAKSNETATQQAAIPKLTITVSNVDCGGGIVSASTSSGGNSGPQSPLVVRQLPGPSRKGGSATSSSPERVPKLMISRQDSASSSNAMVVVSNHSTNDTVSTENKVVPKLTIKTNSVSDLGESKESKSAKFTIKTVEERVPKLTIKTLTHSNTSTVTMQQSSEESDECVSLSSCSSPVRTEELNINTKVVPKLTIKNLCSPQPTVKTSLNMNNLDAATMVMTASKKCAKNSVSKNDISVTAKENPASPEKVEKPSQQLLTINDAEETIDEAFATVTELTLTDVPPTTHGASSSATTTTTATNGGESSSSQEFCGFNDNTTDSQTELATAETDIITTYLHGEEPRRHSDDMDIDDALQQEHAPQIFNNVSHFSTSNGDGGASSISDQKADLLPQYLMESIKHPKLAHVIDTVDLTSSPSPGSSPAHFNYNDNDTAETEQQVMENDYLLDCLEQEEQQQHEEDNQQQLEQQQRHQQQLREKSVIQQAKTKPYSILLEQLTNHLNDMPAKNERSSASLSPSALRSKPATNCISNNSMKYPHLAERLMANGIIHMPQTVKSLTVQQQSIIMDSIEILDTPEGSPRSSLDEEPTKYTRHYEHHIYNNSTEKTTHQRKDNCKTVLSHNNNNNNLLRSNHVNLKRHVDSATTEIDEHGILQNDGFEISPNKLRRIESDSSTMATITFLTNDHQEPTTVITTSPTMIQNNHCHENSMTGEEAPATSSPTTSPSAVHTNQLAQQSGPTPTHRSRKQKHENLLAVPMEEEEDMVDPLNINCTSSEALLNDAEYPSNSNYFEENSLQTAAAAAAEAATPITAKKRGRPRKNHLKTTTPGIGHEQKAPSTDLERVVKSRRVQLLRKRLAIDMVATEQPPTVLDEQLININATEIDTRLEGGATAVVRSERALRAPLRTSRRSLTPNTLLEHKGKRNNETADGRKQQRKKSITDANGGVNIDNHQQFGSVNSNSSLASSMYSSASSMSSSKITATEAVAMGMASQIDLTMSSTSSTSSSNSSTTITTVEAGVSRHNNNSNSMLPPTTILSSSDPLVDVVFKPNDFSSLVAVQQLLSPANTQRTSVEEGNKMLTPNRVLSRKGSRTDSQDEEAACGSGADNSGDDSASSSSTTTPGRGRGRGRGRSSCGRGSGGTRGSRGARLGRGASALAKSIAMSRPRCVGGLKHMPDPERLKGLFSPAPQVFEEDTRMSADLSQTNQSMELSQTAKQLDFLTNDESQSSVISDGSILDPNNVVSLQNGAQIQKRPKKKKMEVCVAEEDFTVASIAEYDWPPPKGCCPSKNRDTFMIQEQVALFLGIKSFKRKYPDLPRRQVDMEERNWLQEKGLVSEKMCDLGITAVWASDILDIMYTDFYEKYEEYKDFIRQKHLREIESKQKALGLNVNGRGLQARDRAMLSASKWNAYFNKTRKEERNVCLDLQTLTVNVPLPTDVTRSVPPACEVRENAENNATSVNAAQHRPPLLNYMSGERVEIQQPGKSYPLALVPGQYCEKYRHYTALELRSFPINTVLDDPNTLQARLHRLTSCSQAASETDTDSATETITAVQASSTTDAAAAAHTLPSNKQRLPVRRSRRARTNATSSKSTLSNPKFVGKIEQLNKGDDDSSSDEEYSDGSTSSSSSSSSGSSSETDSDSDSSCSSANEKESLAKCGVCQHTQNKNLKNLPEVFIKCYTCRRRVHPSCIEMPHRMVARVRNYNWQCADCKCCIKCKRKHDQNKMLFCEQCDRGFHIYCVDIKTVPDGRWSCERCSICIRCGATKPEGLQQNASAAVTSGNQSATATPGSKQIKQKKVKWINEYRIDHITKLREHCAMLCVPCGRTKTTNKRYMQNSTGGSGGGGGGSSGGVGVTTSVNSQMSPPPPPSSVNSNTIS